MMPARDARWAKLTGLTVAQIAPLARDASLKYDNGCGEYSSGFGAGVAHSSHLPEGSDDRRLRSWGDYLIDTGEALRFPTLTFTAHNGNESESFVAMLDGKAFVVDSHGGKEVEGMINDDGEIVSGCASKLWNSLEKALQDALFTLVADRLVDELYNSAHQVTVT